MGRYYSGDIEGKFWVGVQDSNDADFFGVTGDFTEISYYFSDEDLPNVLEGIEQCNATLGDYKQKMADFFSKSNGYSDKQLAEQLGVSREKCMNLLMWYARLELGEKIAKCIQETGECGFSAEL